MSAAEGRSGPVVVDTGVFSARAVPGRTELRALYAPHLDGRPVVLSFQTVAELRFGAINAGWGNARLHELKERISATSVAMADDRLVTVYAELQAACRSTGHALGQDNHTADRWIAATAVRYGIPLVSHDSIFIAAPGLNLITALIDQ